jgi:hypothetical protein
MHFDILVEDFSGKQLLDIIVPQIINSHKNTYKVYSYKGCGRIPKDLHTTQDPVKRILLEQLPSLLQGFGKRNINSRYDAAVIIVVDCDKRDCKTFKQELINVLSICNPRPVAFFRIAIEEMEAWLLGDKTAVQVAYPKYNADEYDKYKHDSIVGTWEKLADITLSVDMAKLLKKSNFAVVGKQKSDWARNIGKHMDVHHNASQSFNCFKNKLEELAIADSKEYCNDK